VKLKKNLQVGVTMKRDPKTEEVLQDFQYKNFTFYDNKRFITQEFDKADDLSRIEKLVKKIIQSEGALFFIGQRASGRTVIDCEKPDVFKDLKRNVDKGITKEEIAKIFPGHSFSRYVDLYFEHMTNELELVINFLPNCNDDVLEKVVDMLNQFINNIRIKAKSPEFKVTLNNYQRPPNKNYQSAMGYINKLLNKYQRLQVLRYDFHYKKDVDNPYQTEIKRKENYSQAKKDFKHFLNNTRSNKIFANMVGYVWKLGFDRMTGFHYHLMLFFCNEKKIQLDVNKAEMIGEYWNNTITKDKGRHFNFNKHKNQYKALGIGIIHRDDVKARGYLKKAVEYLIKTDDYKNNARVIAPENGQIFGKGKIPKNSK